MKNNKLTDATLVDHIIAIRVDPSRRLDPSNLQSLCNSCHIEKTREDMKKFPEYLYPTRFKNLFQVAIDPNIDRLEKR